MRDKRNELLTAIQKIKNKETELAEKRHKLEAELKQHEAELPIVWVLVSNSDGKIKPLLPNGYLRKFDAQQTLFASNFYQENFQLSEISKRKAMDLKLKIIE